MSNLTELAQRYPRAVKFLKDNPSMSLDDAICFIEQQEKLNER